MQKHTVTSSNTIDIILLRNNTSQLLRLRGVSVSADFMEYRLGGIMLFGIINRVFCSALLAVEHGNHSWAEQSTIHLLRRWKQSRLYCGEIKQTISEPPHSDFATLATMHVKNLDKYLQQSDESENYCPVDEARPSQSKCQHLWLYRR